MTNARIIWHVALSRQRIFPSLKKLSCVPFQLILSSTLLLGGNNFSDSRALYKCNYIVHISRALYKCNYIVHMSRALYKCNYTVHISRALYKCSYIVDISFVCLDSLTKHHVFEIHLQCCIYQQFLSLLSSIPWCNCITICLSILLLMDIWVGSRF